MAKLTSEERTRLADAIFNRVVEARMTADRGITRSVIAALDELDLLRAGWIPNPEAKPKPPSAWRALAMDVLQGLMGLVVFLMAAEFILMIRLVDELATAVGWAAVGYGVAVGMGVVGLAALAHAVGHAVNTLLAQSEGK